MVVNSEPRKELPNWIWPPHGGWAWPLLVFGGLLLLALLGNGAFGASVVIGGILVFFYYILQRAEIGRLELQMQMDEITERLTTEHVKTLWAQMYQARVVDPYGNVDATKSNERVAYFITNVLMPEFARKGIKLNGFGDKQRVALSERLYKRVMKVVEEYVSTKPDDDIGNVRTGIEYEHLCLNILERDGWIVSTTPVTGDQGADLIATKNGSRLVVQCKLYSQPVGNKAVQEVFSAKKFQNADFAAVVTNAAYTASARQLASSNGVHLLHHDELSGLAARLLPTS